MQNRRWSSSSSSSPFLRHSGMVQKLEKPSPIQSHGGRRQEINEPVSRSDRQLQQASVIVPVFNGAAVLNRCLLALSRQGIDANSYEVIVVDDGSSDRSAEIAGQGDVTVIRQGHRGAAAARNRGAQRAQGQILLFTDADCEPTSNWIECMLEPFSDGAVSGAKGVYRTRQDSLVARFTQAEYEEKYDRLAQADQIDFVDTHAAAYRREMFLESGGFDPDYLLDEDQEFSFRLAEAGHRLVFAPKAVVYHQHATTVWAYARRKMGLGRWKIRVHIRHPAKAIRDSYTPLTQKAQIVLLPLTLGAAVAAVWGGLPWSAAVLAAILGLMSSLPLIVKAGHQGWQIALVAPALILVRALSLGLGLVWGMAGMFALRR